MASPSFFPVSPSTNTSTDRSFLPSTSGSKQNGVNINCSYLLRYRSKQTSFRTIRQASSTLAAPHAEETKECALPTWAEFELGRAPVYWKTLNRLPPTFGEYLNLFFNPTASKLTPNKEYGIAFNAVSLIFSFTNGFDWDGPYKLKFEVLKAWRNKPLSFFNEGLAEELSKEGACAEAIFPDSHVVVESCEIENLYLEGGDHCKLYLVPGCMDPSSPLYDPLANVDDGSCPIELESDSEEETS